MKKPNPHKYDAAKYGSIINWDKHSLKINGQRVFLVGGEFHYWRVPDKERWADLLKSYKAAGLNCVRIYFHWGYHSPSEGKYVFDGNRDVDYLLRLCEEIGLFVLVASGPYICAETTAGGYPLWLLQKRDVNIRHMKGTLRKKYDEKYMAYCKEWFSHFIPLIKNHQRTTNSGGCIIGYQVENEYSARIGPVTGIKKYMIALIQYLREFGVTVPIFHNDGIETGSWDGLVDLYGFDEYVAFANPRVKSLAPESWDIRLFKLLVDRAEATTRGYRTARNTPIFIPELQGGWFNHWTVKYGFDDLYNFYGSQFTKMLVESSAAQGASIMDLYMFYGGTNHGTLSNPEVYTSYDYAGCLREYGYQNDRLKLLRQFLLFARSFQDSIAATDRVKKPTIKCTPGGILHRQRRGPDGIDFYFLRNFTSSTAFSITLADGTRLPKEGNHVLNKRESFVAIGNHAIDGFTIKFCSMPVLVKVKIQRGTIMVVENNGGELLLDGTGFEVQGDAKSSPDGKYTRVSFAGEGKASISAGKGKVLDIICLSRENALSCNAWISEDRTRITWGSYASYFGKDGSLEIQAMGKQDVHVWSPGGNVKGFTPLDESVFPGLQHAVLGEDINEPDIETSEWSRAVVDLAAAGGPVAWKPIDIATQKDPIDHGYINGHVAYKCVFNPGNTKSLGLSINIRHKAAIWLNGKLVGAPVSYAIGGIKGFNPLKAGSINGPDVTRLGKKTFDLSPALVPGSDNVLVVLTESMGQNKQIFIMNDCRNPRGILSTRFTKTVASEKWFIAGTDVTAVPDPYGISGLPGEGTGYPTGDGEGWEPVDELSLEPGDKVTWFKAEFSWSKKENAWIPLRLHLDGMHNASIYLNGHFVGRYWGEKGPQHDFYLMDKLLKPQNTIVLACWTTTDDTFSAEILTYTIDPSSGNIDAAGVPAIATLHKVIP
nr:beta-galactosidase [Candidatus Sigynarchaeota archaeon]